MPLEMLAKKLSAISSVDMESSFFDNSSILPKASSIFFIASSGSLANASICA